MKTNNKLIIILLYHLTIILYECQGYNNSPIVSKCCPKGYIIQESSNVLEDGYCIPYVSIRTDNLPWHPNFKTNINEDIPTSTSQVMESMLNHCSDENIISIEITGNEKIITKNNALEIFIQGNPGLTINVAKEEVCFDRSFTVTNRNEPNLVLKYCPCKRESCVYLCCATIGIEGYSRPDNYKCGYSQQEWETPLRDSLFTNPDLDNVNLEIEASPSAECLRTISPVQVMQHPDIVTHHNFHVDKNGYLNIGRTQIPRAKYCIGLENIRGNLKTVAYTCSSETLNPGKGGNTRFNVTRPQHGGAVRTTTEMTKILGTDRIYRYKGPNHSWLAGLGAAISIISLALLVISSKQRGGLAGFSLVCHCITMIFAFICIAYLPMTWGSDVFDEKACDKLGSLIQFSLLCASTWFHLKTLLMLAELRCIPMKIISHFGSTKTIKWWYYIIVLLLVVSVPIILTVLAVVNSHIGSPSYTNPLPDSFEFINKSQTKLCWFQTWKDYATLYMIPMVVDVFIKIIHLIQALILKSRVSNSKTKMETNPYDPLDMKADRFILCCFGVTTLLTLIIVVCEIICFNFPYYWYSLSGVLVVRALLILLFFCVKPKMWVSLKTTLCGCCLKNSEKSKGKSEIYKRKEQDKNNSFLEPAMELQEKKNTL